jgi:hypothetical protein
VLVLVGGDEHVRVVRLVPRANEVPVGHGHATVASCGAHRPETTYVSAAVKVLRQ